MIQIKIDERDVSVEKSPDNGKLEVIEYVVKVAGTTVGYLYDKGRTARGWSWMARPRPHIRMGRADYLTSQDEALRALLDYVGKKI